MATWRETFPWISDEIPDIADEAVRAAQIAVAEELAAAILRLHTHRTFGELFSTMATDFQLSDLQVDARYRRAFDQLNVITLADLAPHQLWELTDLRGVSQRGAHLIVRELILANLITPRATEDLAAEAESEDDSASEQAAATVEVSPEQTADLTLLARWRWLIGQQDAPLLRPLEAAPELILHARERLASLPASALLTSAENLAEVLTAAIESLGEREQYIMKQRSFADQPCTLDALGDTIGVTRERVRQIQRGAHRKLRELIASRPAGEFVAFLRQRIEIPTPLATLIAHYSALGENVAPVAQPVWRVLDVLDDSYEVADGWCASPAIAAAKKATGERLQQLANAQGVVPISDVWLGSNEAQGRPAWLADWLTHLGYTMRGDYLLLDTKSMESFAAALLSIAGKPLDVDELHEQIGRGVRRTLLNGLHASAQITRVGPQTFALSEWQLPEYTSIRDEIAKIVQASGGREHIDVIIESLTERFEVSSNSVYAYATTPPFKLEDRIVSARSAADQPTKRNPAEVGGYYRRGEQWLMRDTVNADYLRGSGRLCSSALATIVGLEFGEETAWDSPHGKQTFYFRAAQPTLGSIRLTLQALGMQEGDEFLMVFKPDKTCTIEPLPPLPDTELARALRAVGADVSLQGWDAFVALAAAVECRPEPQAVIAAYEQRGEHVIAEVVRAGTLG